MNKPAQTSQLSNLHAMLARTMEEALTSEVRRIELTKEIMEMDLSELDEAAAKVVSGILSLAPTARVDNGLLKTIASFLKDNGITSDLEDGEVADETAKRLADMQQKRKKVSLPTDHIIQ